MATINGIKAGKKFISCVSDGMVRGRDNVEYTVPYKYKKVVIMQYIYDDYDSSYWINEDYREFILEAAKKYFETTGRHMLSPIPSNQDYKTDEKVQEAYIRSLVCDINMLTRHEKEFKKEVVRGTATAIGFQASSIKKLFFEKSKEENQKLMKEAGIADWWSYYSLDDFVFNV